MSGTAVVIWGSLDSSMGTTRISCDDISMMARQTAMQTTMIVDVGPHSDGKEMQRLQ